MNVTRRRFLEVVTVAAAAAPAAARSIHHAHRSHFMLYAKLDKHRRMERLAQALLPAFKALPVVPSHHPYFDFVSTGPEILTNSCTPTCC